MIKVCEPIAAQAEAANKAAEAAKIQSLILKSDQRASIWISNFKPTNAQAFSNYVLDFTFENIGKSLATHVKADFTAEIGDLRTPPAAIVARFKKPCEACNSSVMAPGVSIGREHTIPGIKMNPQQVAALTFGLGNMAIWFIGRIDYNDINEVPHISAICEVIRVNPVQFNSCPDELNLEYAK